MDYRILLEHIRNDVLIKTASHIGMDPNQLKTLVKQADVSEDAPHGNWILLAIYRGLGTDPESLKRLHMMLKFFVQYKKHVVDAGYSTNIYDYKTFDQFAKVIRSFNQRAYSFVPEELPGVQKIYDRGAYAAYKVSNADSLGKMGKTTKWCTREDYDRNHSNALTYINQNGYVCVITKFNTPVLQFQPNLSQVKSINDKEYYGSEYSDVFMGVKNYIIANEKNSQAVWGRFVSLLNPTVIPKVLMPLVEEYGFGIMITALRQWPSESGLPKEYDAKLFEYMSKSMAEIDGILHNQYTFLLKAQWPDQILDMVFNGGLPQDATIKWINLFMQTSEALPSESVISADDFLTLILPMVDGISIELFCKKLEEKGRPWTQFYDYVFSNNAKVESLAVLSARLINVIGMPTGMTADKLANTLIGFQKLSTSSGQTFTMYNGYVKTALRRLPHDALEEALAANPLKLHTILREYLDAMIQAKRRPKNEEAFEQAILTVALPHQLLGYAIFCKGAKWPEAEKKMNLHAIGNSARNAYESLGNDEAEYEYNASNDPKLKELVEKYVATFNKTKRGGTSTGIGMMLLRYLETTGPVQEVYDLLEKIGDAEGMKAYKEHVLMEVD